MSDTTGWIKWASGRYDKHIGEYHCQCDRMSVGHWHLTISHAFVYPHRPTLRECQILAHATARLWDGETE